MLKNFLKISLRGLRKNAGFSLINISGLALSIASCILILIYVNDEWNYDAFHENKDHLYRITTFESDEGLERFMANAYYPLAPILEASLPEKSKVVRYLPQSMSVKNPETNEIVQEKQFYFADSLFFELFSFEFTSGDKKTALDAPNSIVLTRSVAERYFGNENPIGKALLLENTADFLVTAVVEDPPANSTIQFEFIAAMSGVSSVLGGQYFHPHGAWYYPPLYTFAYIPNEAFVADWPNYQRKWAEGHLPDHLIERYTFHLQPIQDMHFLALENDLAASVKPSFLWVLAAVALLILVIACINYINLALTRLIKRFPEMGMRKVLGAVNWNILQQLSVEAMLFVGISLLIGMGLVQISLPFFNQITEKELGLLTSSNVMVWGIMVGVSALITFLIVLFPYIGLAKYKIIGILKGKLAASSYKTKSLSLKNGLIVFQFVTATGLIIATMVIQHQLKYLNQKDIGFQPKQVIVVPIRDWAVQKNYEAIKNNLLTQTGVNGVSAISNFPWEGGFYDFPTTISGDGFNKEANTPTLLVDPDFLSTMNIEIKEGRGFSTAFGSDETSSFIVNEAAVRKFNLEDLNQMRITMDGVASGDPKKGRIIGVAKDFHMKSLHNPIEPLILTVAPEIYYLDNFVIQLETANLPGILAGLAKNWEKVVPDRPFEYFFLDDAFDSLYQKEQKMGTIFKSFTYLALFIAFLGLLALSALAAQQRTKEIGIRKVLGASLANLVQLLTKDFLKLVFIALVFVSPLAWYIMNQWLENFAYHINIQWWIFALAGLVVVAVAFLTVSFQSIRAALANPVDSLRNE